MIPTLFVALIGTLVLGCGCTTVNLLDTALMHSNNVHKIDLTKFDLARTGQNVDDIYQFEDRFGGFQFIKTPKWIPWKVITFKLKLRENETVFSVEINWNDEWPHEFHESQESARFSVSPKIEAAYSYWLDQVSITLSQEQACFAIWDITKDHNTSMATKPVHFIYSHNSHSSEYENESQLYLVNSSTAGNRAYMNFTFDDPDSSMQYCFWLSAAAETSIELYASVFGAKQAKKLARFDHSTQNRDREFCLTKYLYVLQLGKFELSFVFAGQVDSENGLIFSLKTIRIDNKKVYIRKVEPGWGYIDSHAKDGSIDWWYNNPALFGYTAVANPKTPLYVCDILANCYPYERGQAVEHEIQVNDTAKEIMHMWNFALPEKYKPLLSHSPLIRFYSDDSSFTVFQFTPYLNAITPVVARLESHLRTTSPKLQLVSKYYLGQLVYHLLQVPRQTRIPLEIPLNAIDLRAQTIYLLIEPLNKTIEAKVNLMNKLTNITYAKGVSTACYFKVAPSKMPNDDQLKLLELEFEVDKSSQNVTDSQLVDLEIHFYVDQMVGENRCYKNTAPVPTFGSENCHKGPTYADLDCHHEQYQCPEYYFKYDPIAKNKDNQPPIQLTKPKPNYAQPPPNHLT